MPIISITKKHQVLNHTWKNMPLKQKEELLKARGFDKSWAKTKTIRELVDRGGGMVAKDLLSLIETYITRNPQIKKIRFK